MSAICSGVKASVGPVTMCPAFCRSTSMLPCSEITWPTASSTERCDDTSSSTGRRSTSWPAAYCFASAACVALWPSMSRIPAYTTCPASASARALRAPNPLEAPVMTIVLVMTLLHISCEPPWRANWQGRSRSPWCRDGSCQRMVRPHRRRPWAEMPPIQDGWLPAARVGSVDRRDHAAVDVDRLSCDPTGLWRGEEAHHGNDVGRLAEVAVDGHARQPGDRLRGLGVVEEAGLLWTGGDAVDSHPARPDLLGERLGEMLHRCLAARVRRVGGGRHGDLGRDHVDDPPVVGHLAVGLAHEEVRDLGVDRERVVKVLLARLDQGFADDQPRGVHEDVPPPEAVDGRVDQLRDLTRVGQIALMSDRLDAEPFELVDDVRRFLGAMGRVVVHDEIDAVAGERLSEQLAQIRGAPGDDRDSTVPVAGGRRGCTHLLLGLKVEALTIAGDRRSSSHGTRSPRSGDLVVTGVRAARARVWSVLHGHSGGCRGAPRPPRRARDARSVAWRSTRWAEPGTCGVRRAGGWQDGTPGVSDPIRIGVPGRARGGCRVRDGAGVRGPPAAVRADAGPSGTTSRASARRARGDVRVECGEPAGSLSGRVGRAEPVLGDSPRAPAGMR